LLLNTRCVPGASPSVSTRLVFVIVPPQSETAAKAALCVNGRREFRPGVHQGVLRFVRALIQLCIRFLPFVGFLSQAKKKTAKFAACNGGEKRARSYSFKEAEQHQTTKLNREVNR